MACHENDKRKLSMMDEFANAAIKLNTVGRSRQVSCLRIQQKMNNELFKRVPGLPQWYSTGSFYESMPFDVCGDQDMMFGARKFPIVLFDSAAACTDQYTCGYVKAEHNPREPLYLTLKAIEKDSLHADLRHIIDEEGYLKTTEFIESNRKHMPNDSRLFYQERHGPSAVFNTDFTGPGYKHPGRMLDYVFCMKCQSWPSISDSFFTRQRPGNWPSHELLNNLKRLECLVVAVSHPDTSHTKPEWRLSFSLAEKELIHHMSEPYMNCMFALKAIKRKYIVYSESEKPTPFCSYFIKTACLWMCETIPCKEYNITDLIRMTIDWLVDCYQRRNLPNYFVPEQNLIGSLSDGRCDDVITKLRAVQKDLWKMVVSSVSMPLLLVGVIHPMCDKLNINKINESGDHTELETSILNDPRGCDILYEAIKGLIPGGLVHVVHGSLTNSLWTDMRSESIFQVMENLVTFVDKEAVLSLPEEILLPIIERIDEIVLNGNEELFKQSLYRYLGNIYTYMLVYYNKTGDRLPSKSVYWKKPVHFYELALGIRHPEKWNDCEVATRLSIIVHHYLLDNYTELKEKLATLTPILLSIKNYLMVMCRQISIEISAYFSVSNWSSDIFLHSLAKTQGIFYVNPIVLAFYINARVYLKDGDIDGARKMANEIEKSSSFIIYNPEFVSSKLLLNIIQSLIGLLGVAKMIKLQLNEMG